MSYTLYVVSTVSETLYIASKSVLYTLYSVTKCLIDSLSVLFEVYQELDEIKLEAQKAAEERHRMLDMIQTIEKRVIGP